MNQQFYRNMALWVVILVMILLLATMLRQTQTETPPLPYSEFLAKIETGEIESVEIEEGHIEGVLTTGSRFTTFAPVVTDELLTKLYEQHVRIASTGNPNRLTGADGHGFHPDTGLRLEARQDVAEQAAVLRRRGRRNNDRGSVRRAQYRPTR